jgi:hypothetical protein
MAALRRLAVKMATAEGALHLTARECHRLKNTFVPHHGLHVGPLCGTLCVAGKNKPLLLVRRVRVHLCLSLFGFPALRSVRAYTNYTR